MQETTRPPNIRPLYVAFEGDDLAQAQKTAQIADSSGCGIKIGVAAFAALGAEAVASLSAPLFLDLKLHDIPSVVAKAVLRLAAICKPQLMTLHSAGGIEMLEAAVAATAGAATAGAATAGAATAVNRPRLLAVTVLTSLAADEELSARLAKRAKEAGMDGIVCSALEAARLRRLVGDEMLIVTPGIRPKGSGRAEQKRVATPQLAAANGVDCLVVGRPITESPNPQAATEEILSQFLEANR